MYRWMLMPLLLLLWLPAVGRGKAAAAADFDALMRDESDELAATFGFESDGWIPGFGYSWGCLTPYYLSPFRFNIFYLSEGGKSGHYAQRDSFIAVLFDAQRTTMYLFCNGHPSHRWYLLRYRKQ